MRSVLYVAALALAAALPLYVNRGVAQESADASAEADANTDAASGEASAGVSADAQPADADAQSSEAQTDAQSATGQTDTDVDASQDASTSSPSLPSPARDRAAEAEVDADAKAEGEATRTQRDSRSNQFRRDGDRDLDANVRGDTDVSVQGRTRIDARQQRERQFDARRGIRFGRGTDRGLTVGEIERDSFYFDSGLRRGDVIISLHGQPIRSEVDFHRHVTRFHGQRVPLIVLRDGRRETIYVEYPRDVVYRERVYDNRQAAGRAYLGVVFDSEIRDAAVIRNVAPGSPAEEAGLRRGDNILALNGEEVMSYQDVISIVHSMRPGDRLDIVVMRGRSDAELQAVLAGQPGRPLRTARNDETDVRVGERTVVPPTRTGDVDVQIESRDDDRRILDRDRDEDGRRDRGLLRRLRD